MLDSDTYSYEDMFDAIFNSDECCPVTDEKVVHHGVGHIIVEQVFERLSDGTF